MTRAHSIEAERLLLGGVLLDPQRLDELADLRPDHFYRIEHVELWRLLLEMREDGSAIDAAVSVPNRVMGSGQPDRFGGLAYVLELPDRVPATANLRHYAEAVRYAAVVRQQQEVVARWAQIADDPSRCRDLVKHVLRDVGLVDWPDEVQPETSLEACIDRALAQAARNRTSEGVIGVPWPWDDLQWVLAGTQPGEVCIVAARPSIGKTAVAQELARSVAARHVHGSVLVYNFEGTAESIALRHLTRQARVHPRKVRTGDLSDTEMQRLREAAEAYYGTAAGENLHIIGACGWTIEQIEADVLRRQQRGEQLGLVIIDYLQLVRPSDPKVHREQQVARISSGCMRIAAREGAALPVVALSQLNRDLEKRTDKRPTLSDLRESGSLEQDASQVVFIHREIESSDERSRAGPAELIVAKNRNGETGSAKLWFEGGHFTEQR